MFFMSNDTADDSNHLSLSFPLLLIFFLSLTRSSSPEMRRRDRRAGISIPRWAVSHRLSSPHTKAGVPN